MIFHHIRINRIIIRGSLFLFRIGSFLVSYSSQAHYFLDFPKKIDLYFKDQDVRKINWASLASEQENRGKKKTQVSFEIRTSKPSLQRQPIEPPQLS